MLHEIQHSELKGAVNLPASKSYVQRFLAAALLSKGDASITAPGNAADVLASLSVIQMLGASARIQNNGDFSIKKGKPFAGGELFCGESGLCARMFAPIAGLSGQDFYISGYKSMQRRHFFPDFKQLEAFGLKVKTDDEKIPVHFSGRLKPARATLDASRTSQLLTGLLFALPLCDDDSHIKAENLVSKPYIDMTISLMREFGVSVEVNGDEYHIQGNQSYTPVKRKAETDWSAAANFMVAAALTGECEIRDVSMDSHQADKVILDVFDEASVDYEIKDNNTIVVRQSTPGAFTLELTDVPDLFPALLPLACRAKGPCRFSDLTRLQNKESNRLEALVREYRKLGAEFEMLNNDQMLVHPAELNYADVNSWGDHRVIMSLMIAGIANEGLMIHDSGHVSKSFPDFFEAMKSLNAKCHAYQR
ncbi:MAG: 3-phosphoshikimate 1-carboxyvinyltransferase [Bacteroidota bacterium]|nr:3-phosphoshikimate 1-carboxyvinyltransferase [Bacteroidota bacterium]